MVSSNESAPVVPDWYPGHMLQKPELAKRACWCWRCHEETKTPIRFMILCPICGNKRCPRANDHDHECTGSNEVGQPGSAYENGAGAASARRHGGGGRG